MLQTPYTATQVKNLIEFGIITRNPKTLFKDNLLRKNLTVHDHLPPCYTLPVKYKHLASILVLTLFIITTTNIEEKSIQQHGKGYIVPSKNNYRLDKIGCYMHTRPKSTRAKVCFSIKKQQYLFYVCYTLLLQASDIELNPEPNTTNFPCYILLLQASDIELNPGPNTTTFPCYILLLQASDIEINPGPNTTTFPCYISKLPI